MLVTKKRGPRSAGVKNLSSQIGHQYLGHCHQDKLPSSSVINIDRASVTVAIHISLQFDATQNQPCFQYERDIKVISRYR